MSADVTPERIAVYRAQNRAYGCFIVSTAEGTNLLDALESARTERDTLRAEVQRLTAEIAARDAAGVPELKEEDIWDIHDAWGGLEDSDPSHYFTIHEHGVREGYKLACSRLSRAALAQTIQIAHIGDSVGDVLQPDGSIVRTRRTGGEVVSVETFAPAQDVAERDAMRADGMPADRDALQAMLDAAYNKGREDVHAMHETGAPLALVKAERDALASLIRLRYPRLLERGNPLYDATLAAALAHEQPGGTA